MDKRIIGDDGSLELLTLSTTLTTSTGAETIAANTWVKIGDKAPASSQFGDLAVGDWYVSPVEVTPTTGDAWYVVTAQNTLCYHVGSNMEIAADEVEVTTLCDTYKKYRKGKKDLSGDFTFQFIKGKTDDASVGLTPYFFKVAEIAADGSVTSVTAPSDAVIAYVNYIDDTDDSGEYKAASVLEVELYNFSLPQGISTATQMTVPYRAASQDPVYYKITNP